ncbi:MULTISPECIES: hypothetical protein [Paracoccus]|uniref:Uncharacterized protein n=1 Tax=Paracoccus litorisediminis TaxID=2006130 RepID=A0A844HG45_9RHOB|nr:MULTISPECIES: hypothetical protein [Paracoccus]MBD9525337.1 hypothetical protein [Paracoccus sp. PAR01]MTH57768.1 hypothetical protein [Paracoccus litorisediminis]
MAKSTSPRKTETPAAPVRKPRAEPRGETFVERLARARTANEMSSIMGLKPITGRSGPKIAY